MIHSFIQWYIIGLPGPTLVPSASDVLYLPTEGGGVTDLLSCNATDPNDDLANCTCDLLRYVDDLTNCTRDLSRRDVDDITKYRPTY